VITIATLENPQITEVEYLRGLLLQLLYLRTVITGRRF
jgi:hypothetical protein